MSDNQSPLTTRANPADEAVRESRHQVLRELLGAYADRELPPETTAQIDAHLIGCVQCRRELEVHDTIRGRLAAEPPAATSPALRARIASALDAIPAPVVEVAPPAVASDISHRRITWIAIAGWVTALVLAIALAMQGERVQERLGGTREIATPIHSVALLDGVLGDYDRVAAGELPGRARDLSAVRAAVSFPIEPLQAANLRLVGAWTTELRGEPAAVLAYRLDDRLVVQYLVAEDAFFRAPAVRAAVADRHLLTASVGERSIVAWPDASTGTVLVGDVPARQLRDIWITERLH
ncbi:MAG TPA: zf-HC2 domain-containing protein [Gemmatimonadaceae bacterium]|nr:zf-HC2 domain-containing protein [Gemmatimonadaceae bacterium]